MNDLEKEYIIKEKYCPSRKMNVPVMIFADASRPPQCWDSSVCNADCSFSFEKNNEETNKKENIM